MRELNPCPDKPATPCGEKLDRFVETFNIHVITPLFGGGVVIQNIDPITVVRGTAVRGNLRFWWRATKGTHYPSVDELRKRETEVWGSAEVKSKVSIQISMISDGKLDGAYMGNQKLAYVLFPFSTMTSSNVKQRKYDYSPDIARVGVKFLLKLTFPSDLRSDVRAAVWAWVNFGGLGARTRRGCGALYCPELSPSAEVHSSSDIEEWYQQKLADFGVETDITRQWPTIASKIIFPRGSLCLRSAMSAWKDGIVLLRDFRQGTKQGEGRNLGNPHADAKPRPGRSRWPEADSLRRITGYHKINHKTSITTAQNAFPRAEFGMPILFHFPDGAQSPGKDDKCGCEPFDVTLVPDSATGSRMASPLIIRPLPLGDKIAVPMIMRLNCEPLKKAKLASKHMKAPFLVTKEQIRNVECTNYPNSPMKDRSNSGSALEAFMSYVAKRWDSRE